MATFTRKRYRTVIVPVWFLERKSWLLTRVRSVIVPVLRPVHTGAVSYRSEAFLAKTSKRKSVMSTNFTHCRIKSNFYLKFNKHEKKIMESFEFKSIEQWFVYKNWKILTNKETDTEKMKIWWNFQFNCSGKLEVLCIKSPKKFHKILAHKIHQAPNEFFLRHCESECLWLLNSPETGKKVCL